eukprot:UN19503
MKENFNLGEREVRQLDSFLQGTDETKAIIRRHQQVLQVLIQHHCIRCSWNKKLYIMKQMRILLNYDLLYADL